MASEAAGVLIAHLSDTHLAAPGALTCGVAPMADNLARCVARLNALAPRPDLLLISGDITHNGSRAEAELAREILSALAFPYYLVPGNHDSRATLREVFASAAPPSARPAGPLPSRGEVAGGFCNYVIEDHPLRIIALDTLREGHPGGEFCARRASWLAAALAAGGARPTVIFMHHPPLALGVPETDQDGFLGAAHLGRIIARHPNIERILCGHVHLATHARWSGTTVTTAPSPGMRLTLSLESRAPSGFFLSEPEFLLHHHMKGRALVTHLCRVSESPGPHPFT